MMNSRYFSLPCFLTFVMAWQVLAARSFNAVTASAAKKDVPASLPVGQVYEVFNIYNGLGESRVRCLSELPDGRMAIGTAGTITLYDGTRFQSIPIHPNMTYPLSDYHAYRRLACDVEGRVWLRNAGTLCVAHPAGQSTAFQTYALGRVDSVLSVIGWKGDSITSFFLTNRGDSVTNYWVTDTRGNFFRIEKGESRLVSNLKTLEIEVPEEVFALNDRLFLGYHTGRICEFRLQTSLKNQPANTTIGTLVFSGTDMQIPPASEIRQGINMIRYGNQLWMTINLKDEQHGFVKRLDLSSHEWLPHAVLPMRISSLGIAADSSICLVGTSGMYIFSADGLRCSHIPQLSVTTPNSSIPSLLHDDLSSIVFDRFGNLWIGATENGLLHWHPGRSTLIHMEQTPYPWPPTNPFPSARTQQFAEKFAPDATNCAAETSDGTVYLGTRQGLLVIHPDGRLLAQLDENDGFSSANIHAILPLSPADIWVATPTGITHVNAIGAGTFYLMHFDKLDGLNLNGCELHPCEMAVEDSTGMVRVGFLNGSFVFKPAQLLASPRYVFRHTPLPAVHPSSPSTWMWWLLPVILAAVAWWVMKRSRKKQPMASEEPSAVSAPPVLSESKIQEILQSCQPSADTSSDDERFLTHLQKVVEAHLDDEAFSVQGLASEMAMDRTVLFRRMQSLTGTSPSAYIRSVRMNIAARLLRESQLPIADIALQTGFATTKYFSRIFKETYGVLPKEYRNTPS